MRFVRNIIVLHVVLNSLSATIEISKYTRRHENKAISREVDMSHKHTVSNPLRCALACRSSPICQTFTYSHKDCRCYPQPLHKYEDSLVTADHTAIYTTLTSKVEARHEIKNEQRAHGGNQSHGQQCEKADDCGVQDSICHKNKCLCQIGLYYSRSQDKCLRKCDRLVKRMDLYTGVAIKDHNDISLSFVRRYTCFERCFTETRIRCVSAEWEFSSCQLSKVGFLDVPKEERQTNLPKTLLKDVYFGQRQCE